MRVRCHLNLPKTKAAGVAVYSVQDAKTRRVVWHDVEVNLVDVEFLVSEAGRRRAQAEGVRNVHAYVAGTLVDHQVDTDRAATYRPFDAGLPAFLDRDTGLPVYRASTAHLGPLGVRYSGGEHCE